MLLTGTRQDVAAGADLWAAVDTLADRAPRLTDLRAHGLHLLAARHWQATGRPVPQALVDEQRAAAFLSLIASHLLERARDACSNPVVLMKGPELAARYPDPALRPFRDLDLLAADAPRMQRELLDAGFEPVGIPSRYEGIHHLRPLRWPGLPLVVEVHDRPKWPGGISAPPRDELLAAAVPSAGGVEGVLTLAPEQHALVVAAHSWAHVPLGRIVHLVDVSVLLAGADRERTEDLARRWGIDRVWHTTLAAADALLRPAARSGSLPVWARSLREARERTVLESHLERWFGYFSAFPPREASRHSAAALRRALRRRGDESRSTKLRRTARATRDAFARQSDHHRALDRWGIEFGPTIGDR
jgi:hypothetical protein